MTHPPDPLPHDGAATVAPRVHLVLLGQPAVHVAGHAPHVLERHDAALLARLALHGPLGRADAAAWLWPGQAPARAQAHLRQRLYRLRHALGFELVLSLPDLQLPPGLMHDLVDVPVDVTLAAPVPAGRPLLGTLSYRDGGGLADWVDAARAEWRQRRVGALAAAADASERAGRFDVALRHAGQLRLEDPASEHAHRRVMRLHYLRGDAAAGLAAFDACVADLRREVDAAPGADTQALAALLRTAAAAAPAPAQVPAAATSSLALQRPPRLVGRQAEWQRMQSAWHAGAVLLLVGEGGVGKSRLAGDFMQAHGGGLCVKAHPGDAEVPYTVLAALLREAAQRHGPAPAEAAAELRRLLPGGRAEPGVRLPEPLRLRELLGLAITHWQGCGLAALLVDDLQFADAASLALLLGWLGGLGVSAARPAPPRLPVLLTSRPAGAGAASLDAWSRERAPGRLTLLRLAGLNAVDTADLVRATGLAPTAPTSPSSEATLAALHRRSGGNPLFVLEILRAGADAAPESLRAMLLQRLAALPAAALRMARLAALAGSDFSVDLAAEVLGVDSLDLVTPWQQLIDAEVMDDSGWTYDLLHEALRDSLPAPIARDLHGRIACALQRRGASASRIAEHAWHGEAWALAATHCAIAAEAARAAARPQEALALLDRSAHGHARCGDADAAFAAAVAATQAAIVVEIGDAVARRVTALLADARTPSQRLDALLAQCRHALTLSDWPAAREPSREALTLAGRLNDAPRRVAAVAWRGLVLALDGDGAAADALFDATHPAALGVADARVKVDFFANHGHALHCATRYADALAPLRTAMALAGQAGWLSEAMVNAANISVCLWALGDQPGAIAAGEQGLDCWRRLGEPRSSDAAALQLQLGTYYLGCGRHGEAIDLLRGALAQFNAGQSALWVTIAECRLALVYLRLGQPGRARQVLTPLPANATPGNRAARLRIEVQLDALAGRPVLARLRAAVASLPQGLPTRDRRSMHLLLGALLPADEAVPWCEALYREAAHDGDLPAALSARARWVDALRRSGRIDDAAALALHGLAALATAEPLEMARAEYLWLMIQALDAAGDAARVGAALQAALDWLAQTSQHVPPEFVDSFRERHPVHRALLAFASRRPQAA